MPYGPVFTTADIGGGKPYTRLRGPLLIGYSTGDPGGQTLGSTGDHSGTAANPAYSFFNRPDAGHYGQNVTSSASDIRFAHHGLDLISYSSTRVALVSTDSAPPALVWANGLLSSASNAGAVYIPQTTYAVSSSSGTSSGVAPTAFGSGAALIFDALRNKLSIFSTIAGQWLSVTLTSS